MYTKPYSHLTYTHNVCTQVFAAKQLKTEVLQSGSRSPKQVVCFFFFFRKDLWKQSEIFLRSMFFVSRDMKRFKEREKKSELLKIAVGDELNGNILPQGVWGRTVGFQNVSEFYSDLIVLYLQPVRKNEKISLATCTLLTLTRVTVCLVPIWNKRWYVLQWKHTVECPSKAQWGVYKASNAEL